MTLQIKCCDCEKLFCVDGYTTLPTHWEPGETVTELEPVDEDVELCECLADGADFEVVDEDHQTFDDDVI